MTKLSYLGGVIAVVFVEFAIVSSVVLFVYWLQIRRKRNDETELIANPSIRNPFYIQYVTGENFIFAYESTLRLHGKLILLITRVVSFCFFVGIAFLWSLIEDGGSEAKYFTHWNIYIIVVYYSMASTVSIVGVLYSWGTEMADDSQFWSPGMIQVGYVLQVLFEVVGATAIFVTLVVFTVLDPSPEFWNMTVHLFTTLSFFVEMSLNMMPVRWEHLLFNLAWAMLYLLYIWPAVAEGAVANWPYFFLEVDSGDSFAMYAVLIVCNIIMYYIWYGLYCLKCTIMNKLLHSDWAKVHQQLQLSNRHSSSGQQQTEPASPDERATTYSVQPESSSPIHE